MNINFVPGDIYKDTANRTSYVMMANGKWRVVSTPANVIPEDPILRITGGPEAPDNPFTGQYWIDVENDSATPYVWDGDEWLQVSPSSSEGTDLGSF